MSRTYNLKLWEMLKGKVLLSDRITGKLFEFG